MDLTSYLLGKKTGGGGGQARLQIKNVTITENTTTEVKASTGYDGLSQVNVTTAIEIPTIAPSSIAFHLDGVDTIDVSGINPENIDFLDSMFSNCSMLTTINWGDFGTNTYNVTSISGMFANCNSIETIDLSSFDFTSLLNVMNAFESCYALTLLDVRTIDFTSLTDYADMLSNVDYGCTIVVADTTQQNWFTTEFPDYINVVTVEEYEV